MSASSKKQSVSSGAESDQRYANVEERKRKRMISNRESARRSRMRKQKLLEDLVKEASQIEAQNAQLRHSIGSASQRYVEIQSANNVLRAQALELTDRLRSMNSVLLIVEEVSGIGVDIPAIPDDPLLEPWQIPCPLHPIVASASDMFLF